MERKRLKNPVCTSITWSFKPLLCTPFWCQFVIFNTPFPPLCSYHPTVCGKFDTFSLHNLTDSQWPWHAAIFIRSPPDRGAGTHRPRGMSVSIQQGASEESTFWYLACSGALLTQRGVLVAAQCVVDKDTQQTLHPAQVKVVIGGQYQTSKDQLKSLHHLRVKHSLLVRENPSGVLCFGLYEFAESSDLFPWRYLMIPPHKIMIIMSFLSSMELIFRHPLRPRLKRGHITKQPSLT